MTTDADTHRLLADWCSGDADAVVELVRRDAEWIRQRIRRARGGNLAEFETVDQVQELLVDVLSYRPRFLVANRKQLRALLGRMIENDLIDRARALQRRPLAAQFSESIVALDPKVAVPRSPASLAGENEDLAWIRIAMEFLEDDQRQVVLRHLFEGAQFTELEAELGVAANTLRMRFTRAVAKLAGMVERLRTEGLAALDLEDEL